MNRSEFIGNLGKDPEIITMQNGVKIAKFNIAVTENWKDKNGEKQSSTEWVPCVAFDPLSNVIEKWLKKGDKVFVAGKFTTNKWEDKEGVRHYKSEIVVKELEMLGSKQSNDQNHTNVPTAPQRSATHSANAPQRQGNETQGCEDTDELPF